MHSAEYDFAHFLVIRTDRLGDMVMSLPLFASLKQAFPRARLSVLASRANADLARLCPQVDKVLVDTVGARDSNWKGTLGLAKRLRAWRPDVVLFGNVKHRLAVAAWLARVPIRVGIARRVYSILYTDRVPELTDQPHEHETNRTLRLLQPLGIAPVKDVPCLMPGDSQERASVGALLQVNGIDDSSRIVVVHPSNGGNAMNASSNWYATLADALGAAGFRVVLAGTAAEQQRCEAVMAAAQSKPVNLGGKLSIPQLLALYARSTVCIATSTGAAHLSAALGVPTIGLYAPLVKQARWLPRGPKVEVLRPEVGMICATCLGPKCAYFNCMNHISERAVVETIMRLL